MHKALKISFFTFLIIVMASFSVSAKELAKTPLKANQLVQIQKVGQNVIGAMRTASSADRTKAVAEINAIKKQVDLMIKIDTTGTLRLQKEDGSLEQAKQKNSEADNEKKVIRARLSALKAQSREFRNVSVRNRPIRHSVSSVAITSLDQEIEAVLDLPTIERNQKLRAISNKLRLSKKPTFSNNESGLQEARSKVTPTFQTRTKHRREF